MVFVAVPLPSTGAWTASVAAFLLGIRIRYSFVSISIGTILAGVIVTYLSCQVL
ncbi:MAG: small multi-drug export protein [Firmicutes bacterium]|nr:small multi-drug export protein [Bacillota bacterium]